MKKSFDKYTEKRFLLIRDALSSYGIDKDPKHLHRLRVQIKKLRSVVDFYSDLTNRDIKLTGLKVLYRKAGQIRELGIDREILKEYDPEDEALQARLEARMARKSDRFIEEIPRYTKHLNKVEHQLKGAGKANKKVAKLLFRKRLNGLRKSLVKWRRKDLHELRKEVKRLGFVYRFLPEKVRIKLQFDPAYFNRLQELAGAWHDRYQALKKHKLKRYTLGRRAEKMLKAEEGVYFEKVDTLLSVN